MSDATARPRYILITDRDHDRFCQKVNDAMARGYRPYGSPMFAADKMGVVAGQALTRLPDLPPAAIDAVPRELRGMLGLPE